MGLVEAQHLVDDASAHQPEVARVRGDVDLGDPPDDPVAEGGDDPLGQRSRRRASGAGRRRRRSPRDQRSIISPISSGGSCRSQSMTTQASPEAMRRPAIVAAGWPKRRESRSILTRGSSSADLADAVLGGVAAGVEAEDDLVVDARRPRASAAAARRAGATLSSSLRQGTTTETTVRLIGARPAGSRPPGRSRGGGCRKLTQAIAAGGQEEGRQLGDAEERRAGRRRPVAVTDVRDVAVTRGIAPPGR